MKDFLLTIAIEGLEDKYSIKLSRGDIYIIILDYLVFCTLESKTLKNRKYFGKILGETVEKQHVRERTKPFIIEVDK